MKSVPTRTVFVKPYALFFQALANQTRMQVLHLLADKGSMNVSEICGELALEQTHVSHSLKCLTFCGLVTSSREGKSRIYSVNEQTVLPLLEIVDNHLRNYASNLFTCDALER
ncbi:MAG: helix-turn-helix transcriptional regulator [Thaumarchaeota archaeon]|nr:helix-turn-helix transcriptional regulator [Nitrososphaerota archaeon]MBI3116611.1 helix-turn-helix transcriptional regulator [Nitrososphaerota archaeon]